ncbi:protein arginine kinase [Vulcanibacillus modesticaldus]|uniref:Protein-arginine kinase n=1 Tax=Vulcanibacillus modesticaldus TaxID=337097 RepID=A0A1D2YRX1_9BACI|nr:protein arginine kinase [Vulcanibacillus modesticaldus]OEF96385.1 protein arginine kinase [Vulcanibacillus modesticaldus]
MAVERYLQNAISDWMCDDGPESDIVISSRVRIARNLKDHPFPLLATDSQANAVINKVSETIINGKMKQIGNFDLILLEDLNDLQKKVLVEKHLISLNLANESRKGAVTLSENEAISIMINEEDHIRIQCLYPGLQINQAWEMANKIDDILEKDLDYAFDEKRGYLTSCPTNVGTGIRASVMVHLPALVLTNQMNRLVPAITQVGLTVRGIYGEGSEALGNLFQISNQITLGQSEEDIIRNLHGVVNQIIELERQSRRNLVEEKRFQIEDKVGRAYGILSNAKIIDSKEAAQRLSDLRLGIDLKMIKGISASVVNELMVMTQPGFLQYIANEILTPEERDIRRATIIRKKLLEIK